MIYLDDEKQIEEYKRQIASLNYYKKQHKEAIVEITNKQLLINEKIQHLKKELKNTETTETTDV